jgi:DNA methylase/ParB-like nuclease domain
MSLTPSPVLPPLPLDQYEALRDHIARNGVEEPILVTSERIIIDGHERFKAVTELGLRKYPIRILGNMSEQERKEKAIALNLLRRQLSRAERQYWLEELIRLNPQRSSRDLAATANVSQSTAARAKAKVLGSESNDSVDVIGRNGKTYTYKPKPAVGVENPQSAKKAAQLLTSLGSGAPDGGMSMRRLRRTVYGRSVEIHTPPFGQPWTITSDQAVHPCEAVITDPPFGVTAEEWDRDIERTTRAWASAWNESEAHFICTFFSQRHLFEGRRWLDESLTNYKFVQLLSASYPNYNLRFATPGQFQRNWDVLLLYRRKNSKRLVNPSGARWTNGFAELAAMSFTFPQSNFNGSDQMVHPYQKSLGCMRWLVQNLTKPGDLVADPFAGSGTTGIAAVQLGRRAHLIEIDAKYRDLAEQRLAAFGRAAFPTFPPRS